MINFFPIPKGTILDIGCMDDYLKSMLSKRYKYTGIDSEPLSTDGGIKKLSIEDLKDNEKFDIVIATEVLEHLKNPVDAMEKIKRLAKQCIVISVPNEPFFSLFRFFIPAKEHLWTISPEALKMNLGEPFYESRFCFKRHYFGVWLKSSHKDLNTLNLI